MRVITYSNFGYEGNLVNVEVDLRRGIPAVDFVGLADGAVKECRERVRAAISNSGFEFPPERVLISLSPADLRKEGAGFDLPVALGIMLPCKETDEPVMVIGELSLSGNVLPVRSVYTAVSKAVENGINKFIIPETNLNEIKSFDGIQYIAGSNLAEIMRKIEQKEWSTMKKDIKCECVEINGVRFPVLEEDGEITGSKKAIRALCIAAAGGHNVMFVGGPGCGKTLMLLRFSNIVPLNTTEEAQTVSRIWSLAGLVKPTEKLVYQKPFRMPHQTASLEGFCGGGINCRPGEVSLAHNGVLFLDEAAEFRTLIFQMLRIPLENGSITLSRAGRSTVFPAKFQLLMAINPCPCGNYGSENKICLCSTKSIEQYWKKISEPLIDQIDIRIMIEDESEDRVSYSYSELREIISKAIRIQRERGYKNANLTPDVLQNICKLSEEVSNTLDEEIDRHLLSARAVSSVIKMARTIADLEEAETITKEHLKEALSMKENVGLGL